MPPVPPAAAPPVKPMDLPSIPDAPPAISQVQVNQEDGNLQNEPDPDFDQARQAHQANIQIQLIDNEFQKKPMLVPSK